MVSGHSLEGRPSAWDSAIIDHTVPLPRETNNYWNQAEHVVVFSTCIGLVAVFGMMVYMWTVIAGLVQCTSEKNKMRYVSVLLKSCIERHCGSETRSGRSENKRRSYEHKLGAENIELGNCWKNSVNGARFCCTNNSRGVFNTTKLFVLTEVAMSEADDICISSDRPMSSASNHDDMDVMDPFPDRRLSEVVAKMLDIDSDESDVIEDEDDHVTAFINYNEEPRNKGLSREPLKPIAEEDDNISQTGSIGKITPVDPNKFDERLEVFDTLPVRPVVKAKSVETVFDVYPSTTTTTTTECTFISNDVKSPNESACRNTRFRWSVTSV